MSTTQQIVPSVSSTVIQATQNANTLTRKELRRYIAGPWGLNSLFVGVASDGVNVTQNLKTLVDQSDDGILDASYDSDRFEHAWLYVLHSDLSAEQHRIASYTPSDGSITIGRNFNTVPTSNETEYEIHMHGIEPSQINMAIEWACQMARQSAWIMPGGLVVDGDMQFYNTSAWGTTVGSSMSKYSPPVGPKVLRTIGTTESYVPTGNIAVQPLKTCRLYAIAKPLSVESIKIKIWDATNNAEIVATAWAGNSGGIVEGNTGEAFFGASFSIPVNCKEIVVRLYGTADWQGLQITQSTDKTLYLPDWLLPYEHSIVGMAYMDGAGGINSREIYTISGLPEPRGNYLQIMPSDYGGPIMINVAMPYNEPDSDNTIYTIQSRDYIATGALRYIYTSLARPKTVDTARYEAQRVKTDREWQAYQRSRNPLASKRNSWGKR